MTDMTLDPPTSEDLDDLRALVMARLAKLPPAGEIPIPVRLGEEARDELLGEFLESDEIAGIWGDASADSEDDAVEHLAHQLLSFSLDYTIGTASIAPLR